MTTTARTGVTLAFSGALGMPTADRPAAAQVSVSVNLTIGAFYDELAPYGQWVECRYGECWVPRRVGSSWQPSSSGERVCTKYGWTWTSKDPWGGDPFDYGTWDRVDRYGWVWVPGTVRAPAWVTWSYSGRYVGWTPMQPRITFGVSGDSGSAVVVDQARYVSLPTSRSVGTFVLVLAAGFLLLVSPVLGAGLLDLTDVLTTEILLRVMIVTLGNEALSLLVAGLLVAFVYRVLSDARLEWRGVGLGAALTSLLFSAGRWLLGLHLPRTTATSQLGIAGSLVAVLMRLRYELTIFLFGAEVTAVLSSRRRVHPAAPEPGAAGAGPTAGSGPR